MDGDLVGIRRVSVPSWSDTAADGDVEPLAGCSPSVVFLVRFLAAALPA